MALTVLTFRTPASEHRISCPLYGSLSLGSDPECNVTFEGAGVLPKHCVLYRTGERTFQIIGVFAVAQFSVNGVIASELEVEAPFKFGIGGEVFDVDLAQEGEETLQEMPEVETGAVADGATTGTRPSRRGYLLKPITLKPRAGERVGGVILPTAPAPAPAKEVEASKSLPPVSQTVEVAVETKPPAETKAEEETKPLGEEEESSLLLVGLLVCGLMIGGVFYWPHHLDQATAAKSAGVDAPILSQEATVRACEDLLHAGAPQLAAQVLLPLAEQGNLEAMHWLALALRASGQFGEEEMVLLQQAVTGGRLEALPDFVSVVDDVENPARYTAGAFKHLLMAAKLGEASAWMPLGERYEYGNGTGQDCKKALAAYEKAQAAGDARAAVKISARQGALDRVAAYLRSWNEVSVTTLLDHVAAGQGKFFTLDHPPMEVLLRAEEEMRNRWPLRRISVAAGAQAELETFDRLKVTQPFQFQMQRGERIARGKGVLVCMVQRDATDRWRITDAADSIDATELLPAPEQFVVAASLHELKPAFSHAEQVEEARLGILEQMHGLDVTQDFKPALTVVLNTIASFPQETFWLLYADRVCDRMARQLFKDGKWLDASWVGPVHQLGQHGSVSALLLEGHLYAAGYGYARDPARSVALYKQAFEAGQRRDARFYYAEALFQGRGVPQDIEKAGELALAFMRRSKHPLEAYLAAHLLWRKAEHAPALWQDVYDTLSRVVNQFPPARNLAGMVLLNHGQTTRERRTGFAAIKAAAEEGVVEAMKSLSQCYLEGVG